MCAHGWSVFVHAWVQVFHDLFASQKVVLTPGEACHAAEPGFFRLCYGQIPTSALPQAIARIRTFLDCVADPKST